MSAERLVASLSEPDRVQSITQRDGLDNLSVVPRQVVPALVRITVAARDQMRMQLLVHHVDRRAGHRCVASTNDLDDLVATCRLAEPDLVILCSHGTDVEQLSRLVRELREQPDLRVVVVAPGSDRAMLSSALTAGAIGYVTDESDVERLDWVLDAAAAGRVAVDPGAVSNLVHELVRAMPASRESMSATRLTSRESDVLRLLADGASTYAIANSLSMSLHTVRSHVKSIMCKLGAHTRLHATALAAQQGLL